MALNRKMLDVIDEAEAELVEILEDKDGIYDRYSALTHSQVIVRDMLRKLGDLDSSASFTKIYHLADTISTHKTWTDREEAELEVIKLGGEDA